MTAVQQCPTCGGCGEIQHPSWGSPSCPEPTAPCPTCDGYEYAPQGCDWCGRTSEVTEPTGYDDPAWLCARCMADYRQEAE